MVGLGIDLLAEATSLILIPAAMYAYNTLTSKPEEEKPQPKKN